MNTRGLMELVALNIGYDLGIRRSRVFAPDGPVPARRNHRDAGPTLQ